MNLTVLFLKLQNRAKQGLLYSNFRGVDYPNDQISETPTYL